MDEYCNIPEDHPQSYHYFMFENFFNHVNIKRENIHILNGNAGGGSVEALTEECNRYEQEIKKFGGIELFLGGIGPDGRFFLNFIKLFFVNVKKNRYCF